MILLAILQRADDATGLQVRRELEESADRAVSKGAFYTTLDRLERKGYVVRDVRPPEGLAELRKSRAALEKLWRGLGGLLEGA